MFFRRLFKSKWGIQRFRVWVHDDLGAVLALAFIFVICCLLIYAISYEKVRHV